MTPEYPKRLSRIASVLFIIGSLIWIQWPIDLERFNIASLVLLIASLISWLALEAASFQNKVGLHDNADSDDAKKLNTILSYIDSKQYYILKHYNIETYFADNDYDGVSKIIYYFENDIFPFHNDELQSIYLKFCRESKEFYYELFTLYTSEGNGRATWRPTGGRYVPEDAYREVQAKIAVLNSKATKLADQWEELISVARQKLIKSSVKIEQYQLR